MDRWETTTTPDLFCCDVEPIVIPDEGSSDPCPECGSVFEWGEKEKGTTMTTEDFERDEMMWIMKMG